MDASATPAPPQRRFWLVVGPWHTSSRVAAVLMLLFLAFCNVPGQLLRRIHYEVGHPFYLEWQFEHGWPMTYLTRSYLIRGDTPLGAPSVRSCFELWRDADEFRSGMLLANVCVVLVASFACGIALESWRRARSQLWQMHLRDFLAITLVMSLIAAWYFYAQRRYAAQQQAVNSTVDGTSSGDPNLWSDRQVGGITWLRSWLGDKHFEFLDRALVVRICGSNGWSQLERLSTVVLLQADTRGTTDDLENLVRLPLLEALALEDALSTPDDDVVAELPLLPRLRGLGWIGERSAGRHKNDPREPAK